MKTGSGGVSQWQTAAKHLRDLGFNSQHQKKKNKNNSKNKQAVRENSEAQIVWLHEFYGGMNLKDETKQA